MKRARITLHLGLFSLLVAVVTLSCGKDPGPFAPSGTVAGSRGPHGAYWSSGLDYVPNQAVVTMESGYAIASLAAAKNLTVISDITLPLAGIYDAETYYLVQDNNNNEINIADLQATVGVADSWAHHRVWMPEDDRGGLSFDDGSTWRSDDDYLIQPSIQQVSIPQALAINKGQGELIAIMDTGVDRFHPIFATNKWKLGKDYTVWPAGNTVAETPDGADQDEDGHADDAVGHGTHVAGIIATGAPRATLFVNKVLDDEGRGTVFGLAKALKAAGDQNAHVVNMSLGLHVHDRLLDHVIKHLASKNIAIVASAGNNAGTVSQYPALYSEVLSVAAVDANDVRASFSNYGNYVDIAAPGVDIISSLPTNMGGTFHYAAGSGTSMAAPFVTACIALVHNKNSSLINPYVAGQTVLMKCDDISAQNGPEHVGGRVDFYQAVTTQIFWAGE